MMELFGTRYRDRSPHPADMRYVYRPPMSMLPSQAGATFGGRSWRLTGRVDAVADERIQIDIAQALAEQRGVQFSSFGGPEVSHH